VASAAFSPDGTRIVTASWDGTARVWNAATGKPLTRPLVHYSRLERAAFSPDGTRVIFTSTSNTPLVWDSATGKPLTSSFKHQGAVESAAFSPNADQLAAKPSTGIRNLARRRAA